MTRSGKRRSAAALGALLTALLAAAPARAVDLGGLPSVRSWLTAPQVAGVRLRLTAGLPPLAPALEVQHKRLIAPSSRVFEYFGAHLAPAPESYNKGFWTPDNVTGNEPPWFAAFRTDARRLDVALKGGKAAYRVRVDGRVTRVGYFPDTFGPQLLHIAFRHARMRTITLEMGPDFNGSIKLGGIVVPRGARVRRGDIPLGPRTIMLGDSFVVGVGATIPFLGLSQSTGWRLGLGDVWSSGLGGTGYISRAKNGKGENYLDRLDHDIVRWQPANVIISGGGNDFAQYGADTVRAAAQDFLTKLRSKLPHARVIVVGPFRHTTRRSEDALRQAATAAGIPFIDPTGWITGTGSVDAPKGDGNADRYIGPASENYHPTQAGYEYLGERLAQAIEAIP